MLLKFIGVEFAAEPTTRLEICCICGPSEEIETACAAIPLETLVNVAQAAVLRNSKYLDPNSNNFEHLV